MEIQKEICFDPPLDEISKEEHDFVTITIHSSSPKAIQWLVDKLQDSELWDRINAEFEMETVEKE